MFSVHRVGSKSISSRNLVLLFFTIVLGFASVITLAQINIPSTIDNARQTIAKITITESGIDSAPLIDMSSGGIFIDPSIMVPQTTFSGKVLGIDEYGNLIYVMSTGLVISGAGGGTSVTGDTYWTGVGDDIWNTNSGNIGIGASIMSGKLHIKGSGTTDLYIEDTNPGSAANINFKNTTNKWMIGGYENRFYIGLNSSAFINIITGGYVGIGTTGPKAPLQVIGNLIVGSPLNNVIGSRSTVLGGRENIIEADYAFIGGGTTNTILGNTSTHDSFIGGGYHNKILTGGSYDFIGGGSENNMYNGGNHNFIGGGTTNKILSGNFNLIGGGNSNSIFGSDSIIVGGTTNTITGEKNLIGGGSSNSITGSDSIIVGGIGNTITGEKNIIGGGEGNMIIEYSGTTLKNFIGGGYSNKIRSAISSVIVGGEGNTIRTGSYNFIGGGGSNYIDKNSDYSSIIGGDSNIIIGSSKSIALGTNVTLSYIPNTFARNSDGGGFSPSNRSAFYINAPSCGTNCGGVGINVTDPTTELDIDGSMRMRPQNSADAVSCGGGINKGAMYYSSTSGHFYGCNGATWIQLDN